ncbi:MAG: glycosyltransferase [Desulfovibrionaceae bacterium]
MTTPRVSVLMPAYNAAATLAATLDSLLVQTLADCEIVAVDDGSTDATRDIMAAYARRDARVRPVGVAHGGIVAALNAGLAHCRAPYVARMDADDLCLPERLAVQADFLDAHPDVGLVACRVAFGGDRARFGGYARYVDWTNTLLDHDQISLGRFRESPFAHPSVCFRATVANAHGAYRDGPFPEDYELWLRWLDAGVRMAKVDRELLVWNDPPNRLSRTDPRYDTTKFYEVKTRWLARWLARHNPHHPHVLVMGAGRTTRRRADLLETHGIAITAYVDIDPKKVGNTVNGKPVIDRASMPPAGSCFALPYVANHGADADIRAFLESRGYALGRDFLPVA